MRIVNQWPDPHCANQVGTWSSIPGAVTIAQDGSYLIGTRTNSTVPIPVGVTVLTRLCGYEDASLVTMLKNLGLPLVFADEDRPY